MNGSAALLELSGLTKSFGTNIALQGVDLRIRKGDSLVLIGSSGSGKTLILKCIMGLIPHDDGLIAFEGRDVNTYSDTERNEFLDHFGMTFQKSGLFDSMPVWENVAFRLIQSQNVGLQEARALAIEKLAAVGLDAPTADLYPSELSGGMQKRVGLARAIACEPKLLFLDEPTTGLDSSTAMELVQTLVSIAENGQTVLLSIHQPRRDIFEMFHRIIVLCKGGKVVYEGSPRDVEKYLQKAS